MSSPISQSALHALGATVARLRREQGLSRRTLCERSGLSPRFLAQLEKGEGNISFLRLHDVSRALGTSMVDLISQAEAQPHRFISLVGLRGAGKSTVGRALASALGKPFWELDERIEKEAGLSLGQIFELQGDDTFRRLERQALESLLAEEAGGVVATSGGIVNDPETFSLLRRRTTTVWLKAAPKDHWNRVVAQGDHRPMENHPNAMSELERLWDTREPLYSQAQKIVLTSGRTVDDIVNELESVDLAVA
ncbi:MAG: helix-turn-helix domain-containing protein [Candidatus Eisenbacteria bacterium]|uniref:Shikimate kinase n=1 Tax=Eiseniibacteriota bacterium TaxID=2212470 RepID=A0A7Y2H1U8_UNCEI|nr:helix-turn-helix domain-containing protein [Candidatus Eisenbacteria bacterium]